MNLSFALYVHATAKGEPNSSENECEDERVVSVAENGAILLAALDGCGGTGSKRYPKAQNWTGAKIAAHEIGIALDNWFRRFSLGELRKSSAEDLAENLRLFLEDHLKKVKADIDSESDSGFQIVTGLSRDLPATMAAMTVEQDSKGTFRIRSYWAGNARNYIFTPDGLFQISRDDLVNDYDPYEDLTQDGILSNSVNASGPFQIHHLEKTLKGPFIVMSASDGVFSYFDSPIRFESILLDTLKKAGSLEEWENLLREEIDAYSSDDHVLQMLGFGFETFIDLQKVFQPRTKSMNKNYIERLNKAYEEKNFEEQRKLWLIYKETYMSLC